MNIATFDDLLRAARAQPRPQRLLFVFAAAGLPDAPTAAQRAEVLDGQGGCLEPLMCVDKAADELQDFAALVDESRAFGPAWQLVFAAAIDDGAAGAAEAPLQRMVEAIRAGRVGDFLPFDGEGHAVTLSAS